MTFLTGMNESEDMMNNKILIFLSGVVVGAVCGHVVSKYILPKLNKSEAEVEPEASEEIETESEDETPEQNDSFVEVSEEEPMKVMHDVFDYSGLTRQFGYNNNGKDEPESRYAPYPISQAEYDDPAYADYEPVVLTWYADNILARDDDNDAVILNPEQVVGPTALSLFNDPEVDVVYVRDDSSCVQYEIDRDHKKYEEVVGRLDEEDDA